MILKLILLLIFNLMFQLRPPVPDLPTTFTQLWNHLILGSIIKLRLEIRILWNVLSGVTYLFVPDFISDRTFLFFRIVDDFLVLCFVFTYLVNIYRNANNENLLIIRNIGIFSRYNLLYFICFVTVLAIFCII